MQQLRNIGAISEDALQDFFGELEKAPTLTEAMARHLKNLDEKTSRDKEPSLLATQLRRVRKQHRGKARRADRKVEMRKRRLLRV